MARRKKKDVVSEPKEINFEELASQITEEIEELINEKYGEYIDPETKIVSFGIRPIDAILGGGLVLGMPAMITGAAEIGKTTISWQIIKRLQEQYKQSIALYLDVEGSANIQNKNLGIKSRLELMNINPKLVTYKQLSVSIEKAFIIIEDTINKKRQIEEKLGLEERIPMIVIWDSIADTEPEKIMDYDDPTKLTGYKARLLQHWLGRTKPLFRRNQVLLLLIDQVRTNLSNAMMTYQKTEKEIGAYNNLKSATGAKSVEHKLRQWIFLSQGSEIYDKEGVLGWYLDFHVKKSKLAPSGYTLRVVFDKRYGIDKFWTEYEFISNLTPFEEKIFKKLGGAQSSKAKQFKANIENNLGIQSKGAYKYLQYTDPTSGEIITSKSFYEKDAKTLYNTDPEFRDLFDKIVDQQIQERILKYFNPEQNLSNDIELQQQVKDILKDESSTDDSTDNDDLFVLNEDQVATNNNDFLTNGAVE